MKYIKRFELITEGTGYSALGEGSSFKEVVEFIRNYKDSEGDVEYIAIIGVRVNPDGKIEVIDTNKFEPYYSREYVVFQAVVDYPAISKYLKDNKIPKEEFDRLFHFNPIERNDRLREILNKIENVEKFDYLWLFFDEDGILEGASTWGDNNAMWFADEMGLYEEGTDAYEEYMGSGEIWDDEDEENLKERGLADDEE